MLYPSINDLLDITNNRYILVIEVAKRAREIVDGSSMQRALTRITYEILSKTRGSTT